MFQFLSRRQLPCRGRSESEDKGNVSSILLTTLENKVKGAIVNKFDNIQFDKTL